MGLFSNRNKTLLRQLRQLNIDWIAFAKYTSDTFQLLDLSIQCSTFIDNPSARSLISTADTLLKENPKLGNEFFELIFLAGFEELLSNARRSADEAAPGMGYLFIASYVPNIVNNILTNSTNHLSKIPMTIWIKAYLSARAGQTRILELDEACKLTAIKLASN